MGNIVLSCGHSVVDFDHGHSVTIKSNDSTGGKALAYMTICAYCVRQYREDGDLFECDEDADRWLLEETW